MLEDEDCQVVMGAVVGGGDDGAVVGDEDY